MHLFSSIANSSDSPSVVFIIILSYILIASPPYFFFYMWNKRRFWYAKIQQRFPLNKFIFHELKYSFFTLLIFGLVIWLVIWARENGLTRYYKPIDKYGYTYFFLSIVLMVIVHDTYFYWTHRLLHWKPLFKHVHKTHHLSINPTPFASYSFHPVEAFIVAGIIPLIAFTIPYDHSAFVIFSVYSLVINVGGHLGYEIFPKGFAVNKLFKWHNTSTHHNMHHQFTKCNYGLYFNFWDRIMNTNHPHYIESFNGVTENREQREVPSLVKTELH